MRKKVQKSSRKAAPKPGRKAAPQRRSKAVKKAVRKTVPKSASKRKAAARPRRTAGAEAAPRLSTKAALLGKAELFAQLAPDELSMIARYSGYRTCAAGDVIFSEGTHREELYLIRGGTVVIRRRQEGGGEQDIARFVDGEVFGEMDLMDRAPRTASAVAEGPVTLLVFPDRMEFADILSKHPAVFARVLRKLLGEIARRIRAIDRLISEKTPWIEELKKQLHRDKLTGLYNRAFLEEELPRIVAEHPRTSLLVVKPNNFKTINDTYGHEAGDKTLVLLAEALKSRLQGGDLGARYRGDEYCVILPGQGAREAAATAELLRAAVRAIDLKPFTGGETFLLTGSVGASSHPAPAPDAKALIARAFEQLWTARSAGGDRVLVEEAG